MQTANCTVALAEDMGNTVPKKNVTPAEVVVLRAIHGEGAVFNIDILDKECKTSGREILQDLSHPRRYGRAQDSEKNQIVRTVFPSPMSPLPQTFAEIGLDESMFTQASLDKLTGKKKAPARKKAAPAPTEPKPEEPAAADDAMG